MYSFIKNTLTISINSILKKQIVVTLLFLILLASVVYCTAPTVTHHGLQVFLDGIQIKDPNTASIDPNGLAKFKSCQVNGLNVATLDANSLLPVANTPDLHTNLDANSIGLGVAKDPNFAIKVGASKFTVDNSGSITASPDADTTFTFGRAKIWGDSDNAYFSHFDCADTTNFFIRQNASGVGILSAPNGKYIDINIDPLTVARINNNGMQFLSGGKISYAGHLAGSLYIDRHSIANTAGNALTVSAGGCTSGATDKNGGNLILKSGISTGTGTSQIDFYTATAGTTGTSDNTPSLKLSLNSNGDLIPGIDDNSYIGKNSTTSDQKAYKGVILKDTANTKTYRLEITNGAVVATEIYAP